jgi:hypothetical protein
MTGDPAALANGLYAAGTAAIYAYVGNRMARRPVSWEGRLAAAQFAIFWYALAAVETIAAFESLWAVVAFPPLPLVLTLLHFQIIVLAVLLWGLVGYLVYLYTGRNHVVPLTIVYATSYFVLEYFINASSPDGITVVYGTVGVHYASVAPVPLLVAAVILLIVPEIVGALLYFSLFFRTRERTLRFRIGLVSWGLVLWFGGSTAVSSGAGLAGLVASRALGLTALAMILIAYFPPAAIERRLGVRSIEERPLVTGAHLTEPAPTDEPKSPGA